MLVLDTNSKYIVTIKYTNTRFDNFEPSVDIDINSVNNELKLDIKNQPSGTSTDHLSLTNDVKGSNDPTFLISKTLLEILIVLYIFLYLQVEME